MKTMMKKLELCNFESARVRKQLIIGIMFGLITMGLSSSAFAAHGDESIHELELGSEIVQVNEDEQSFAGYETCDKGESECYSVQGQSEQIDLQSDSSFDSVYDASVQVGRARSAARSVVMSVNVRVPKDSGDRAWNKRLPRIISMIKRQDSGRGADIIGIQELESDTYEDIKANLSGYDKWYVDRGDGELSAIFYKKSRYTYLGRGYKRVPRKDRKEYCPLGVIRDWKKRVVHFVHLIDNSSGNDFYFYNTHFPSKHHCERRAMSKIVAKFIDNRIDQDSGVILVGDINDGIEQDGHVNRSYRELLERTGFRATYPMFHQMNGNGNFRTLNSSWSKTARKGRIIDHILVSSEYQVAGSDIDRSMFNSAGDAFDCPGTGQCIGGQYHASDLSLYSDHWAIRAVVWY